MTIEEMVAMFLMVLGHGVGNRMIQERFQHSGETVSRHFHHVLYGCSKLTRDIIKPKDSTFYDIHPKLKEDKRYWPYFKNCIGAIDGTHVSCIVPSKDQIKYIGRKGFTSQNVMPVCDWDMCFTFVWPGWEGTAHDARIFNQALKRSDLNFPHPPPDKYYLVDLGYPTMIGYLGPYKGERYHLPDFRRNSNFRNSNETFNFFHSSLRCTIERTFEVWKNRFALLRSMPSFKFETQVHLVITTMAIHNFIRQHSTTDKDFNYYDNKDIITEIEEADQPFGIPSEIQDRYSTSMEILRDKIREEIIENFCDV
ncbi:putative nuclease HARBI1 [Capsicum annuum]|uniref:putative nuclease HARBI1 n=1 Tax=Capsicum annuum TaxID=4072 RepID=UPI001FB15951|nr:putative nuclease HARBI1 [Capsicum annuum]